MTKAHAYNSRRRGASLYLVTFMLALIVAGTGVTLLRLQMSNRLLQSNLDDADQAALTSDAGVEWTLMRAYALADWRNQLDADETTDLDLAPYGRVQITALDDDGDFLDNDTDSVTLTIRSDVDGALQAFEHILEPHPHPALGHAIYAKNWVVTWPGVTIRGPVHAGDGVTDLGGLTTGDNASFSTLTGGSLSASLPNRQFLDSVDPPPTPDLSFYLDRATSLSNGASIFDLADAALAETYSTEGSHNPEGIYHINAGGRNVKIKHVFLKGTLIITNTNGGDVTFDHACRFETGARGYPILIIDCRPGVVYVNMTHVLEESQNDVDFNGDGDVSDELGLGFFGLIWTNAPLTTLRSRNTTTRLRGSLIANDVFLQDRVVVNDDPDLADRLVPEFTDERLHLRRGSVHEIAP